MPGRFRRLFALSAAAAAASLTILVGKLKVSTGTVTAGTDSDPVEFEVRVCVDSPWRCSPRSC